MVEFHIRVESAKNATLSDRVEDVFYVTKQVGEPTIDAELADQRQA